MKLKNGEIEIDRTEIYVHLHIKNREDLEDRLRSVFGGTTILLTIKETEKVIKDLQKQIRSLKS